MSNLQPIVSPGEVDDPEATFTVYLVGDPPLGVSVKVTVKHTFQLEPVR